VGLVFAANAFAQFHGRSNANTTAPAFASRVWRRASLGEENSELSHARAARHNRAQAKDPAWTSRTPIFIRSTPSIWKR
jgi:hypothetical protein